MLIAHLADCHLGKKAAGYGDAQGSGRLNSFRLALSRLAQEAPQAILLAGDVFDGPDVDRAIVQEAARAMDRVANPAGEAIPVVLIPGNHDPSTSTSLWQAFQAALKPDTVVRLVLVPEVVALAGGKLLVEAYPCETPYSAEAPWARRVPVSGSPDAVRIVLAHGTLQGGPVPEDDSDAYPFTLAQAEALSASYTALGHFHGTYPPWDGGETIERALCYSGTHEPDQFGGDAGHAILAELEPGKPTRLRRIKVARRLWRAIEIGGPVDLSAAEALRAEIAAGDDPTRFVIRLSQSSKARLSAEESSRLDDLASALRALGAHVDRRGEGRAAVDPGSLDLDALPSGAIKEALLSLRDERARPADEHKKAVLGVALQIGWERMAGE